MKSVRHTTRVYSLLEFLYWFANALPLALLILLLQSRGLNLLQASLLFGVNAITVVLLEVPTGSLADMVGRKRVSEWAALLMLAAFGLFLVSFSFPLLLLGGVIYGASRALASGALDAWFVDTVQSLEPEADLQPLLSRAGVMTLLGLALGTLAGGILPLWFRQLPQLELEFFTELSIPLAASLLVQGIRYLLLHILVVEPQPSGGTSLRAIAAELPDFMRGAFRYGRQSAVIRLILLATFGGGFVMVGLENFWQPHFAGLPGGSVGNTIVFGVIMAGNFILGAAGNLLSPALARRFGGRLGLLAGVVEFLRGVSLLLLIAQSGIYLAGLFFWLVYFGMGVGGPVVGTLLHGEISARRRSTMLSIQSMVSYIGVFAGSFALGVLAEYFSVRTAWLAGSCVLFLMMLPYLKIDRLSRSKALDQPTDHDPQETHPQTV